MWMYVVMWLLFVHSCMISGKLLGSPGKKYMTHTHTHNIYIYIWNYIICNTQFSADDTAGVV